MEYSRHMVNSLNRENRLRQQKMDNLEKETQRNIARIDQELKVAYMKLQNHHTRLLSYRNRSGSMQEQGNKEKATAISSKRLVGGREDKYSFNGESGKHLQAASVKNGAMLGIPAAGRSAEHSGLK